VQEDFLSDGELGFFLFPESNFFIRLDVIMVSPLG